MDSKRCSKFLRNKRQKEFMKTMKEYREAEREAYASIDKKAKKKVRTLEIQLAKAQREAKKTMNPFLVKRMNELRKHGLSMFGLTQNRKKKRSKSQK